MLEGQRAREPSDSLLVQERVLFSEVGGPPTDELPRQGALACPGIAHGQHRLLAEGHERGVEGRGLGSPAHLPIHAQLELCEQGVGVDGRAR
jgi:hypothetical protein